MGEFKFEVQHNTLEYLGSLLTTDLPQSGSVSQPRVAASATLGYRIEWPIQPQRGCVHWRNPFRVDNDLHLLLPKVEATLGFET
jgi:hypothetical protein